MESKELLEKIETVIDNLKAENQDLPVIVEGESDIYTLRQLGLEGTILSINTGHPLFNFCEEIAKHYKKVILLTDWDRKGNYLAKLLSEALKANDVKFNTDIRARLAYLCRKETKDVEGLVGTIQRLKNI